MDSDTLNGNLNTRTVEATPDDAFDGTLTPIVALMLMGQEANCHMVWQKTAITSAKPETTPLPGF